MPQYTSGKRGAPISSNAFSFSLPPPAKKSKLDQQQPQPQTPARASRPPRPPAPPAASSSSSLGLPPPPPLPLLATSTPSSSSTARPPRVPATSTPSPAVPARILGSNARAITAHSPIRPLTRHAPPVPVTPAGVTTPARQPMTAGTTTPESVRLEALPSPLFSLRAPREDAPSPIPAASSSTRATRRLNAIVDSSPFRVHKSAGADAATSVKKEERHISLQAISSATLCVELRDRERVTEAEEGIGVSPRKNKGVRQHKGPVPPPSRRLASLLSGSNTSLVLFYTSLQHTLSRKPSTTAAAAAALALSHLRLSAAVRLEVAAVLPGPTQAGTVLRCRVLAWPTGSGQRSPPEALLVVLQALPADCPRVGVDPRALPSSSKRYEIGIWQPWSELAMPAMATATSGDAQQEQKEEEEVLFASRFIIADAPE